MDVKSKWKKIQQVEGMVPIDCVPGKLTAQGILSAWMPDVEPAATTKDVWKQIQKEAGAVPDGVPAKATAEAIIKKWINFSRNAGNKQIDHTEESLEISKNLRICTQMT